MRSELHLFSLSRMHLMLVPVCGKACRVGRLISLEHKLHLIIIIIPFSLHMTTEFNLSCKASHLDPPHELAIMK